MIQLFAGDAFSARILTPSNFFGALLVLAFLLIAAQPAGAQIGVNHWSPGRIEFSIDVAEDMGKFVEHRVKVGEEPVRGSQFVTEGKIYMPGTIQGDGANFDPNAPGAIGTWFCNGTFLVRGSEFDKSAQAVMSDQLYLLADDKQSLATTGLEGNGLAVRAMIAGTGPYAGYVGEQRQTFLGFNKSGGVNLRVTFTLRKVR